MPRVGLPQGFVEFGTVAHRVLLALHAIGEGTQKDIEEEIAEQIIGISSTIYRLHIAGFIYKSGTLSKYDSGLYRTQWIYSLDKPKKVPAFRKATVSERTRKYRERKAGKIDSVFKFRGNIKL